jgi:BirA family biotin operon repressor/biotin-[acetyl-CoA-carboxylase] ligase
MSTPYRSTPTRRPIDPAQVTRGLADPNRWRIEYCVQTGSTNADLAARAEAGTLESGQVLVTEKQTAGRGRAGRDWQCPAGAGLMFSVAVRLPAVPADRRGWIGAVLGLSIVAAMNRVSGVPAGLKWPNDVLIDGAKCAGILGELAGDVLIVGSGINVSLTEAELPRADATSLVLAGGDTDRAALLAAILDELGRWSDRWTDAAGDVQAAGIRPAYLSACTTIGADVRLLLPAERWVTGRAVDVDSAGALVIDDGPGGRRTYTVGDVVHVRAAQTRSD